MVALVSTAVRLSHSGASTRSTSIGATSRRGAEAVPATKATKPGRTARLASRCSVRVVAAFWARTLRWFASPSAGVDGAQAGLHLVDAAAGQHQRVRDGDRQGIGQALAAGGARSAAARPSPACSSRRGPSVGEHGPDEAGEGREPAGAERRPRASPR